MCVYMYIYIIYIYIYVCVYIYICVYIYMYCIYLSVCDAAQRICPASNARTGGGWTKVRRYERRAHV